MPVDAECLKQEGAAVVLLMSKKNMTVHDLDTLPPAIFLLFYSSLWKLRNNPPPDLPPDAYYLLWRDDLATLAHKSDKVSSSFALKHVLFLFLFSRINTCLGIGLI